MYQLLEDLKELELDNLIPNENELEEYISEYNDYSNSLYNSHHRDTISVSDFMEMFGLHENEDMSYEEQLNQSLADIIGITKPQLKFINPDLIFLPEKLPIFIHMMHSDVVNNIPSVENKIKFATFLTWLQEDEDDEKFSNEYYVDQYMRIVKNRPFSEALSIAREWIDYITMIHNIEGTISSTSFQKLVPKKIQRELQKTFQTFNDNKYPKPSHISDLHSKLVRFKRLFDSTYEDNDTEFKNGMMEQITNTSMYKKFLYQGKKYSIISIPNYTALSREGEMLNHCVKEYINDIIENKCMIYAIRNNQNINIPFYTVEIKRGKTLSTGTNFRLTQCYGYDDTTEKSADLYDFIHTWCKTKGIKIECDI